MVPEKVASATTSKFLRYASSLVPPKMPAQTYEPDILEVDPAM